MPVVAAYEWLFWAGMGVIVMTGVGNLGALAPHIPDPGVGAGVALAVKLPLVLLAVVGSVPRTIAVVRVRDGSGVETARLEEAYAVTAVGLAVVIGVAVVLAHG